MKRASSEESVEEYVPVHKRRLERVKRLREQKKRTKQGDGGADEAAKKEEAAGPASGAKSLLGENFSFFASFPVMSLTRPGQTRPSPRAPTRPRPTRMRRARPRRPR